MVVPWTSVTESAAPHQGPRVDKNEVDGGSLSRTCNVHCLLHIPSPLTALTGVPVRIYLPTVCYHDALYFMDVC